jgi:protein-S-isoprenylcysteine O-methyltransferase Ste14
MNARFTGWFFVAAQVVLLVALVVVPTGDVWPRPPWLLAISATLTLSGMVVIGVAAYQLGAALTPTPEPKTAGTLHTTGLYGVVRHPIYSGVLAVVVGLVVRNASAAGLALGVIAIAFFNVKAAWEERRLAERYESYAAYAAGTPRFIRIVGRRRPA